MSLGKNILEQVILDSTIYQNKLYISQGLIPSVIYLPFVLLDIGTILPFLLHLLFLFIVVWNLIEIDKIKSKVLVFFLVITSPFISNQYFADIIHLNISSLFSFTYFLWLIYFERKRRRGLAFFMALLAVNTRFYFLPFVILIYLYHLYKSNNKLITISSMSIITFTPTIQNFLKFGEFFDWGERVNKIQGDTYALIKLYQVNTHTLNAYLNLPIDLFKTIFLNFSNSELFFKSSQFIAKVESQYLISTFAVIIIASIVCNIKKLNNRSAFIVSAIILFNLIFQRAIDLRIGLNVFPLLTIILFNSRINSNIYKALACIIIAYNLLLIDYGRYNSSKTFKLDNTNEFTQSHILTYKSGITCQQIRSLPSSYRDKIYAGISSNCIPADVYVIPIYHTQQECQVIMQYIEKVDCKKIKNLNSEDRATNKDEYTCIKTQRVEKHKLGVNLHYFKSDIENIPLESILSICK